jgi:MioC protein
MSELQILFGTESGNSEMVAEEIVEALAAQDISATVRDLGDVTVDSLGSTPFILVSSTYNEGDLPASAEPFYEALAAERPDLSGLRFAAFGLGDSTYEHYSKGVDTLRGLFLDLGARQVGDTGRHDASSGTDPVQSANEWATETVGLLIPATVK